MLIDSSTISLVLGVSNLCFALLGYLYIAPAGARDRSFQIWLLANILAGLGAILNSLNGPPSNILLSDGAVLLRLLGSGLMLLAIIGLVGGMSRERERVTWLVLLLGPVVVFIDRAFGEMLGHRIYFLFAAGIYLAMGRVLLRKAGTNRVRDAMGASAIFLVTVLLARFLQLNLLAIDRYAPSPFAQLPYLAGMVAFAINSFGFLLLVKQGDDLKLARSLKELSRSEGQLRELVSFLSHEFRTPAAIIKASLDSLDLMPGTVPPEVARRLQNIRRASQRINRLANEIIAEDRLRDVAFRPRLQEMDLAAEVRRIVEGHVAAERLQLALPRGPVEVTADPALIEIALANLIDNALEHSVPGAGRVRVAVEATPAQVECSVADEGRGIPEPEKARIFERSFSANGRTGRGMGLWIVESIARAHGGFVGLRDNVPSGSVFTLCLPGGAKRAA